MFIPRIGNEQEGALSARFARFRLSNLYIFPAPNPLNLRNLRLKLFIFFGCGFRLLFNTARQVAVLGSSVVKFPPLNNNGFYSK